MSTSKPREHGKQTALGLADSSVPCLHKGAVSLSARRNFKTQLQGPNQPVNASFPLSQEAVRNPPAGAEHCGTMAPSYSLLAVFWVFSSVAGLGVGGRIRWLRHCLKLPHWLSQGLQGPAPGCETFPDWAERCFYAPLSDAFESLLCIAF